MRGLIFVTLISLAFASNRTPGGTCPEKDPAQPIFLPDLCDCTKYYECSGGLPVQNNCSPGLEWNKEHSTCDWPKDAKCTTKNCPEKPVRKIKREENQCPPEDDPNHDVLLPVPGDCHSFYKCFRGKPVQIPCPAGLEWSQELERCEWPEVAKCVP